VKQGKIWGVTEQVFTNGFVSVHLLDIKKGGFCSEHRHAQRANKFYVLHGQLEISIWTKDEICDKTVLKEGQSTIVPIGAFHKFKGLSEVRCLEIYEVNISAEDIERRTVGGVEK